MTGGPSLTKHTVGTVIKKRVNTHLKTCSDVQIFMVTGELTGAGDAGSSRLVDKPVSTV